jgi:hypothetical protein
MTRDEGRFYTFSNITAAAAAGIAKLSQLSSSCQGRRHGPSRKERMERLGTQPRAYVAGLNYLNSEIWWEEIPQTHSWGKRGREGGGRRQVNETFPLPPDFNFILCRLSTPSAKIGSWAGILLFQ